MVTVHDPLTEELQRSRLRLNDELIFSPQKYGDEVFVHIEIPSTSRFFRIGFAEYVFISQFDGETSSATALAVTAQSQGADAINEKKSREVIDWLLENGLAGFTGKDAGIDASNTQNNQMPWYSKLNPFWMKLPLGNPSKLLDAALPLCQWMFHPLTAFVSTLLIFAGAITTLAYWSEIFGGFQVWDSNNWIWLLASWVVLKIVHEFAHAITCRHFGGQVPETGIIFILFAPLAYVDVTSSWRFSNRWKRIAVAAAGMYLELIIASICIFVLLNTDSPVLHDILINAVVMAGVATLLFNANPLMKFDGYFMLSDLLKIPNLFENGQKSFRQTMSWVFLGEKRTAGCHEIRKKRFLTSAYGWLASLWKILICVGMTITASMMFGGFGVLLAVMGMFSWFGKPTYEMCKRLSVHFKRRPSSSLRIGAIVGLVAMLFAASWFWIPSPFCVRAPCLVEFEDAAKVRAQTAGFVAEVLVDEGAIVEIGQPLLRIENRELSAEVKQLRAELKYEQTHERIAIDKPDPAEAQVAVRQQRAIETSLYSREKELEDLMIKAPCSGQVVARDLASMTGKYLEQGDIILIISDESVKEVTVSLPVTEMYSAKNLIGASIPLEIGSRRKFYATISQISPKATTQVRHESLIVPNGGPITVRASETGDESSSEYEYCEPRLSLVGTLDASVAKTLWSGERGFAVLSSNTPTIGKWCYLSTRNWLRKQIEFATPPASQ